MAAGALGDWQQAATLLGVIDTLSERISGQLFPHIQAAIGEVEAQAERQLGPAAQASREAGQLIGRSDQITAALWPDPQRSPEPAAGADLPLTRREREVAELIAGGLTNRQIGGRLFIAERTVDTHVSRILAKLDCSSRAQVAGIVATAAAPPTLG